MNDERVYSRETVIYILGAYTGQLLRDGLMPVASVEQIKQSSTTFVQEYLNAHTPEELEADKNEVFNIPQQLINILGAVSIEGLKKENSNIHN